MSAGLDNVIEVPGALVVGAGLAGLFTALKLAPFPALVLAAARPGTTGSSVWAQGGIAAAVGPHDSWEAHAADTLAAGAGLGDGAVADFVAREASQRIDDLVHFGAPFDRLPSGALALAREAAYAAPSIRILEGFHALELAATEGRIVGLFARHGTGREARLVLFRAHAILFATGGIGALYAVTTNPPESRGEGLGMAARAGARIADAEFVQFHPTAIAAGRDPAPLATEALRGEGAVLIDEDGYRFMPASHSMAELAPRDIVSRAIYRHAKAGHQVFLDCREAIGQSFASRFPTVYAACRSTDIDPACQPIPVAPAAHYHMGGIATDHNGRTSLAGLWAVGECASTGLHGANRLASNSLLEALVFGARAAEDVRNSLMTSGADYVPALLPRYHGASHHLGALRATMTENVGMERDEAGLRQALETITRCEQAANGDASLLNIAATARIITAAALSRRESMGAHFRRDYPNSPPMPARRFVTVTETGAVLPEAGSTLDPRGNLAL
jgi:L-aspartate oxidase